MLLLIFERAKLQINLIYYKQDDYYFHLKKVLHKNLHN